MVKKKSGRPSAVEISPFRRDIEEMLKEGKTPDFISTWLKSNGESISRASIYRYKNDKFNIQAEAVKKYNDKKSKARLDEASDKVVDELFFCDDLIRISSEVDLSVDYKNGATPLKIKELGLKAVRVKNEILKDEPEQNTNISINIVGVEEDEDDNLETD